MATGRQRGEGQITRDGEPDTASGADSSDLDASAPDRISKRWGTRGDPALWLRCGLVVAQAATVIYTWPLWQIRVDPPNLPVADFLPGVSFGWAMLLTLVAVLWRPKWGVFAHLAVLVAACLWDQFRMSPQFYGLALLMAGTTWDAGAWFCRWYLICMWGWAGIHKLLSADWLGHSTWTLITKTGIDPEGGYLPVAIAVGMVEIALAVLAITRPTIAAWLCVAIHLGITLFLSPLVAGMNYSVIPWNLGVAAVGFWLFRWREGTRQSISELRTPLRVATLSILVVMPIGFYSGWVDRSLCHVLYSDNLPRGMITSTTGLRGVRGWGELGVPFPSERRLFRQYFDKVGRDGEKLHVRDPRGSLPDQFYVMRSGVVTPIDPDEFFLAQGDEVAGVALDSRRSLFALGRAGVRLVREDKKSMVYAVAFTPENFRSELISDLPALPNLREIQLADTAVRDEDLAPLLRLRMLTGLGLERTAVTDAGLKPLLQLPYLQYVETEGTSIRSLRGIRGAGDESQAEIP